MNQVPKRTHLRRVILELRQPDVDVVTAGRGDATTAVADDVEHPRNDQLPVGHPMQDAGLHFNLSPSNAAVARLADDGAIALDDHIAVRRYRRVAVGTAARPKAVVVQDSRDRLLYVMTAARADDRDRTLELAAQRPIAQYRFQQKGSS